MKKQIEAWIEIIINKIIESTLLPPTTFKIIWSTKPNKKDKDIETSIQYYVNKKLAKLTIFPPFVRYWKQGKKGYLTEILIHELAHLHTAKLQEAALDSKKMPKEIEEAVEQLVCIITKYVKEILERKIKPKRVNFYD